MHRKWWTLLAVSVATFMLLLDITVVNVALSSIRQDIGASFRHQWGVTPSPGLYTLGLTWQHTCGSALLNWVGYDAAFLTEQISSPNR